RFIHSHLLTLSRAIVDVGVFTKVWGFAAKLAFLKSGGVRLLGIAGRDSGFGFLRRVKLAYLVHMTHQMLAGKTGIVFGVANKRSIAWAIAKAWAAAGARLIFNYQGERIKENVEELIGEFGEKTPLFPCDVSRDEEIAKFFQEVRGQTHRLELLLHSVAC